MNSTRRFFVNSVYPRDDHEFFRKFPISWRILLQWSLPTLLASVFFGALYLGTVMGGHALLFRSAVNSNVLLRLALVLAAIGSGKVCHALLYRLTCRYWLESGHLIIRKGILIRRRGAFLMTRITEAYIDRSARDLLFGLANIQISTPTTQSQEFARIEGLSQSTAQRLLSYLELLLDEFDNSPVGVAPTILTVSRRQRRPQNSTAPPPTQNSGAESALSN